MDTLTPALLLLLGALGYLWFNGVRAREAAVAACRHACSQVQVQFLDQTVRLSGLGLARAPSGSLSLRRHFRFEFSEQGSDRQPGMVVLLAGQPTQVILDGAASGRLVIPMGST